MPGFVVEYRLIDQVIQQIILLVVVNSQALLLDKGIVAARIYLQASGQRNGSQRAVRRGGHVERLGHRDDFLALGNAAGVREVGLNDVGITIDK